MSRNSAKKREQEEDEAEDYISCGNVRDSGG